MALVVYIPQSVRDPITLELRALGDRVLTPQVSAYVEDAERNLPHVESHNAFGQRQDVLKTSEGWKRLQEMGASLGCVSDGYSQNGRMTQFFK